MRRSLNLLLILPGLFLIVAAGGFAADGWIDLMHDGNFTGWTRLPIPPTGKVTDVPQWKVDTARRLIICEGNGGHDWMRYDREFADFAFHVEWRFTPKTEGEKKYNSGVFIRNSADGAIWHQAQTGGGDGSYLFGMTPANGQLKRINLRQQSRKDLEKPAGQWNIFDITCRGKKITLKVNGKVACEFTESEVSKGYVGLEAEGYRVEFRNVRIRELR